MSIRLSTCLYVSLRLSIFLSFLCHSLHVPHVSLSTCLFVSLPVAMSLSVSLSTYRFSLSLSTRLYVSLCHSLPVSISLSVSLYTSCFSVTLYLSLCPSRFSVTLYLSIRLSTCLYVSLTGRETYRHVESDREKREEDRET